DRPQKNNLQGSSLASPYFTPVGHTMARKSVMSYDFNEDDTNSDEDDERSAVPSVAGDIAAKIRRSYIKGLHEALDEFVHNIYGVGFRASGVAPS
ncbi:hypothetical protein THAOC_24905, partial [Thalassiosira oceanica]